MDTIINLLDCYLYVAIAFVVTYFEHNLLAENWHSMIHLQEMKIKGNKMSLGPG